MYYGRVPSISLIEIQNHTFEELWQYYRNLKDELKVAYNIFEFERASDLKDEIEMIQKEISKRKTSVN